MQNFLECSLRLISVPTLLSHSVFSHSSHKPMLTPFRVQSNGHWFPSSESSVFRLCYPVTRPCVFKMRDLQCLHVLEISLQYNSVSASRQGRIRFCTLPFNLWYSFLEGEICRLTSYHSPHSYCIFPVEVWKIHTTRM